MISAATPTDSASATTVTATTLTPSSELSYVERLAPVSAEDLLKQDQFQLDAPKWLTQLDVENRTNLRSLSWFTRAAKRSVDVCGAVLLFLLTLPVLIAAGIAIKLTSRGPVFFTQTRVGLNVRCNQSEPQPPESGCRRREPNYGKPFKIYKLRTMTVAASQAGPLQVGVNDARITPVGRLLRQMRIDELPQLYNVLRGEMSLVGPRPECIEYMEELSRKIPGYVQRLGLKPGLTGIAQIEAGYANNLESYQRKIAFDLLYLQNCSLHNDLKIMLRTVRVVLTGFGAM